MSTRKRPADNKSDDSERRPRNLQDTIRQYKKEDLEKAWDEYSKARTKYRNLDEDYRQDLAGFLREQKEGLIVGSKTDFDHLALWEKHKRADDLDLARRRYQTAEEAAKRVGVIAESEITSNFRDRSDDGYDWMSDDGYNFVSDHRRERIEKWRSDEQQRGIVSEGQWAPEAREEDLTGRRLIPIDNLVDHAWDMASEKNRKRIDRWIAHQQSLRARPEIMAASPDEVIGTADNRQETISPDEPIDTADSRQETIDEHHGFFGFAGLVASPDELIGTADNRQETIDEHFGIFGVAGLYR